jgi:hypothetical protein
LNIDFNKQKKNWIWIFFGFGFWIFLGLDFGFFGFLDFFWVLGFPSKSNPKTQLFLGSNLCIKVMEIAATGPSKIKEVCTKA